MSNPIEKRTPARRTPERTPDHRTLAAAERWVGEEPIGERRSVKVGTDGAVTRIEQHTRTGDRIERRAPHPDTAESKSLADLTRTMDEAAELDNAGAEGPRIPRSIEANQVHVQRLRRGISL